MTTAAPADRRLPRWRIVFTLLLLVPLSVFVLQNGHRFHASLQVLGQASLPKITISVALTVLTFILAAAIYIRLAFKPLGFGRTLLVELAGAFVNRLLPSGLGGLGLHGIYLYKNKHTVAQATAVVSTNNLLGILGHLLLLGGLLAAKPDSFTFLHLHVSLQNVLAVLGIVVVLAAVLSTFSALRHKVLRFVRNVMASLRRYKAVRLASALVLTMCLTLIFATILYTCAHAVGVVLGPGSIFIVFTIGVLLGTATPTPGGLVGVEAGLYGGFLAYHVAAAPALAAVLFFRLLTYWLPLIPGAVALLAARQKKII